MIDTVIIRHLKDIDDLRFDQRDTPLQPNQEGLLLPTAESIVNLCKTQGKSGIHIITSPKARTLDTTRLFSAHVVNLASDLTITTEVDDRIRELDQGEFLLPVDYIPGTKFQPLNTAWDAFIEQSFCTHNIDYHFGDPINNGESCVYPELNIFSKVGESQREFTIRTYSFILDLINQVKNSPSTLPVVITHQALLHRVLEISEVAKKIRSQQLEVGSGDLPFLEYEQLHDLNTSVVISNEGSNANAVNLSLLEIMEIENLLVSEIKVLSPERVEP